MKIDLHGRASKRVKAMSQRTTNVIEVLPAVAVLADMVPAT